MRLNRRTGILVLALVLAGCATTQTVVNPKEPRRLVGTESEVRLDAELLTDSVGQVAQVPLTWIVTNNRPNSIAIADLLPSTSYDEDSRLLTVTLGSEVPGGELLPRLIVVGPGEKKSFSGSARMVLPPSGGLANPAGPRPTGVQVKLNFLGDPRPFSQLVGIPERAIHDPALAEALFPKWLEGNETLVTNVVPMRWSREGTLDDSSIASPRPVP